MISPQDIEFPTVTICGSGQYLEQVEEALYRKFTEQNDVLYKADNEETSAFQKFTKEVYRVEKGNNIIDILSTMISPDLEGNEALQLLRYQQSCTATATSIGTGGGPAYNGISCVLLVAHSANLYSILYLSIYPCHILCCRLCSNNN